MGVLSQIKGRQMAPLGIVRGSENGKQSRCLPLTLSRALSCHFLLSFTSFFWKATGGSLTPSQAFKPAADSCCETLLPLPAPRSQPNTSGPCDVPSFSSLIAGDVSPSVFSSPATSAVSLGPCPRVPSGVRGSELAGCKRRALWLAQDAPASLNVLLPAFAH